MGEFAQAEKSGCRPLGCVDMEYEESPRRISELRSRQSDKALSCWPGHSDGHHGFYGNCNP